MSNTLGEWRLTRLKQASRPIGDRIRLSAALVVRLFAITYRFGRGRVWLVFFFDLMGTVADFAVVAVIGLMVHGLENAGPNGMVEFGGPIPAISAVSLLVAGSILIAAGLSVAGLVGYWARHIEAALSVRLESRLQQRMFMALANLPPLCKRVAGYEVDDSRISQILRTDPRYAGRMLGDILAGALPVVAMILCFVALCTVNIQVTGILVVMLVAAAPFLYKANRLAARSTHDFQEQMGRMGTAIQGTRNWILQGNASAEEVARVYERERSAGSVSAALKTYHRLQILAQSSTLTARVMQAVAIAATLLFGGTRILEGTGSWAELVSFIMILRMTFNYLQRTLQSLIAVNRFALMVNRYFRVVDDAERQASPSRVTDPDAMPDGICFASSDGGRLEVTAQPGAAGIVGCFMPPRPVGRGVLSRIADIADSRGAASILTRAQFVTGRIPQQLENGVPGLTVRQIFRLPDDVDGENGPLRRFLDETGFEGASQWYAENGLDVPPSALRSAEPVTFALQIFAAAERQAPAILIDGGFARLDGEALAAAFHRMPFLRLVIAIFPPGIDGVDRLLRIGGVGAIGLLHDKLLWTASRNALEHGGNDVLEKLSRITGEENGQREAVDQDLELM